jgi:high-affinity nickel permease
LVIAICVIFVICYLGFFGQQDGLSAANPQLVSIGLLPALPVDQMKIAAIDENTRTLSQDKHRITPV